MPSNEAIELLESILNENSRLKYIQNQVSKLKSLADEYNKLNKNPSENDERLSEIKKEWDESSRKVNKYTKGIDYSSGLMDSNEPERVIKQSGKLLKSGVLNRNKINPLYAKDVADSTAGKEAYKRELGGPETFNSIMNPAGYNDFDKSHQKIGYYDKRNEYKNNNKEFLKDRIENAKKNPRKVVGGYKLEAACILIEALDIILAE